MCRFVGACVGASVCVVHICAPVGGRGMSIYRCTYTSGSQKLTFIFSTFVLEQVLFVNYKFSLARTDWSGSAQDSPASAPRLVFD